MEIQRLHKLEYNKLWRLNNKDRIIQYNNANKERKAQVDKLYRATPAGKKSSRINTWKRNHVMHDNFDKLYEIYMNTLECEMCEVELIHGNYGANKKVLDHCHITGEFRAVLCHCCNIQRK
tara:strand:+ start:3351 stop:3713 length:363 start_codon:yes stop_codon:yes gene_type:complete